MGTPVRVLFLTSCVRGGGPGWSLFYLLKHLDRSRVDPTVVIPAAGFLAGRLDAIRVPYRIHPRLPERLYTLRFGRGGRLRYLLSALWNLADAVRALVDLIRLLRSERFDLIYCNNMLVKPIGAAAGQLTGTPVVLHCRNIHGSFVRRNLLVQVARLPAVKRVVCISGAAEGPYRFSGKTVVVPNGVDLDEYDPARTPGKLRAELGLDADAVVVGYLGRIVPWKGIDVLIDAARTVVRHDPRVVFCVVGENPVGATRDLRAEYLRRAAGYGIEGRVRFLGFREDVRPYLRDFDLLALPSKEPEPFGRVNIEAMAMAVPVIATAHGGPLEIIEDGVDGFLVPPCDPDALARGILDAISSPDRRGFGERARRKVRARFDAAGVAGRIEGIIREAAGA
jgi:glycosyltransferase involved in cell wall biosynthesis